MIITDSAKSYIQEAMTQSGIFTLRVVSGGTGCCGSSYQLMLAKPEAGDRVEQLNQLEVAFEPEIADPIKLVTLDLIKDEQGPGLAFTGGSSCC